MRPSKTSRSLIDAMTSRLAFLSPSLQRQILSGRQPASFTLKAMLAGEMPLAWTDQHAWLDEVSR